MNLVLKIRFFTAQLNFGYIVNIGMTSAGVWSVQITNILKCLGKEKLLKAAQCPWPSPELDPQNRISPGWTSQLAGHWWCSYENQLAPNCEPTHLCKLNIHLFGSTRLCINELKTRTMFEEYHEQILSHIPEHIQCIRVLSLGQVHRGGRSWACCRKSDQGLHSHSMHIEVMGNWTIGHPGDIFLLVFQSRGSSSEQDIRARSTLSSQLYRYWDIVLTNWLKSKRTEKTPQIQYFQN